MMKLFLISIAACVTMIFPLTLQAQASSEPNKASAAAKNDIGYASPQAALDALRKRTDVEIGVQEKWLIIRDTPNQTLWSFAPPDHPAYPAVIKRNLIIKDGRETLETRALCQAKRDRCDKMMADLRNADEKKRASMQSPASPTPLVPSAPLAPLATPTPPAPADSNTPAKDSK